MDPFQALLLSVSKELTSWDDNALIFLCQDLIPSRTRDLQNAEDVFLKLQENDLLDKNNTFILQELLWCIGRNDLLFKKLKINKETVKAEMDIPGRAKTKPYRRLLFSLAEEVTDEDLKEIKLILHKDISRAKMRNITSMLDIFNEMEKNGSLDGDSLCNVKRIFKENNHILEMIGNYEAKVNDANNFQNVQDNFEKIPQAEDYMLQQVYNMSSKPRGICVVINNFDFGVASKEMSHITDRQGTDVDRVSLCRVFSKMHFKAEVHNNLDREQILQTVRSYSRQDHKGMDCFICCILSHGDKGVIYGTNGQTVQISALTSCFKKDQCPSLAGKPKVFFIQACQGQNNHEPVQLQVDAHKAPNDHGVSDDEFIPNEPDFLLGMATTLNYVSYRHPVKGSLYIQSLCHHLVHCREEDVLSILTKVNNDVSQTNVKWKCWKQMPQPCSSLTKKLIFPMN